MLCGYRGVALAVVRIADSPPLKWTLKGPSHHQLDVVCSDAVACLKRRAALGIPGDPVRVRMCQRGICRTAAKRIPKLAVPPKSAATKPPRPLERHEVPAEVERHNATVRKIEAGLAQPDKRLVCPNHGPKNTMLYLGVVRFTCCGAVVPGAEPKVKARRVV